MRVKENNKEYIRKYRFNEKVVQMKEQRTMCQRCFEKLAETLHHKDEVQANNKDSNLLPVCRDCHLQIAHQSDYLPREGLNLSHKCPKISVTDLRKTYEIPESVTTYGKTLFKKGNLVVLAEVSIRVQHLFEDWGFERLKTHTEA